MIIRSGEEIITGASLYLDPVGAIDTIYYDFLRLVDITNGAEVRLVDGDEEFSYGMLEVVAHRERLRSEIERLGRIGIGPNLFPFPKVRPVAEV